jgi:hypothetical protein
MAGNEFGCLVGISRLYVRDEFAVLTNDRGTPGECEIETPADGSQHFAVLPPKLGGMAVIVPLVHHGVEGGIQLTVPECVGEVVLFNQTLDTLQFGDVLASSHIHKPSRQGWLNQNTDLVDIPDKILIYGPDTRPAVGEKGDKALSTQQLQGLAHGVGRSAVTPGEISDHKTFVGGEPSLDDVFPDQFVERGALAGRLEGISPDRWLGFEGAYVGQSRLPGSIHALTDITHDFHKQCTIRRVDSQSAI